MGLTIYTKKKTIINKQDKENIKKDLDEKKVDNLNTMVKLLGELNTNISNIQINQTSTKPKPKSRSKSKTKEFIPSIDTKQSSDKVTSVKKTTKKRKLSSTVDKLKATSKKK